MSTRFGFGVLLLALGVVIAVIGLLDLGVYLTCGVSSTLSQEIADAVDQTSGLMLFFFGSGLTLGLLTTHFTGFRMTRPAKSEINVGDIVRWKTDGHEYEVLAIHEFNTKVATLEGVGGVSFETCELAR